jgi:hypothetical protein
MAKAYYEPEDLKVLSDYDLYYKFKILEKRLLIAESSKFVPYDVKEQMREFYDSYVEELDRRVDSGELTTMELEDIDEQVDLQIEKEEREKKGL